MKDSIEKFGYSVAVVAAVVGVLMQVWFWVTLLLEK
jgi:hypothetical protein